MKKRVFISIICMIVLVASLGAVGQAAAENKENVVVYLDENGNEIATPRWSYTATTGITLEFKDGRIYMVASIEGHPSCSYITARAQLEKKGQNGSYDVVATYLDLSTAGSSAPDSFWFERNRLASVNESYRFTVYATVYGKDGGSEPITLQTTGTYYPS